MPCKNRGKRKPVQRKKIDPMDRLQGKVKETMSSAKSLDRDIGRVNNNTRSSLKKIRRKW